MSLAVRSNRKELLDENDVPEEDLIINLRELEAVNRYLGGHRVTCTGVLRLMKGRGSVEQVHIAEIGSGGGDNLHAIQRCLAEKHVHATYSGVDKLEGCIRYARQRWGDQVQWLCSDYRDTHWLHGKPDILFSSLFCHHFTDDELVAQLRWMKDNSQAGFFVNDLHRHPLAYYSIGILTQIFSRSRLVKNDAPLSVQRGFVRREWKELLKRAGIERYEIQWCWAFRYLICVKHGW